MLKDNNNNKDIEEVERLIVFFSKNSILIIKIFKKFQSSVMSNAPKRQMIKAESSTLSYGRSAKRQRLSQSLTPQKSHSKRYPNV